MMGSYRAGLGWFLIAGLAAQALSQELSTTGFSNCGSDSTIRVNYANVGFDSSSGSVKFNVSGTSTKQQKVKADLTVTAYGMQVYQNSFDPCSNATKVDELCPVPSGTFAASGNQKIPAEYLSQVPSIAFNIPDIDGNVTLKLTAVDGGAELGCVQSGVSNGKTLQLSAVGGAAAGIAAAAFVVSGVSAIAGAGIAGTTASSVGFATILSWFQTISITGMMSVNYPPVYRSFSQNFAFSTGLISWGPVQNAIDSFRNSTGGNLTDDSYPFVQNASLVVSDGSNSNIAARSDFASALNTFLRARDVSLSASNDTGSTVAGDNNSFTQTVYGIGAFAEKLMIPEANVFMTALLIFGIIAATITLGILLLKMILEIWALWGTLPHKLASFRKRYWTLLAKTLANLILLVYGVWVAWSIFQFTVGDSIAARALAAASLSVFTLILVGFSARIVIVARRYRTVDGDASALYDNKETWVKYSFFYESYRRSKWWMFMPLLVVEFARGAILAAGNGHGLAQTIAQLVVETLALIFLAFNRPFATPAGNWINVGIQVVRVLSFACVLVFVEELGVAQTTQTVTGFVLVVVQAVLAAVLALLIAVNAIIRFCRDNPHRLRRKQNEKLRDTLTSLDTRNSFLARSFEQPAYGHRSVDRLTVHAAAFGQDAPPPSHPAQHRSLDNLAYRQPTLPMV